MKVVITTSSFGDRDTSPLEALRNRGWEVVLNPYGRALTETEAAELLADADGVVAGTEPLTRAVFSACPKLKVVSRVGVGMDSVDRAAAEELGITVRNTPDGPTQAVAELTVGVLLAVLRGIARSDREIRGGAWKKRMGSLLDGKTVGIVGLGRIGCRVSQLLSAFGCEVVAFDACPDEARACTVGATYVADLQSLLAVSDIVTLHVPCPAENRHLFDRSAFESMKPGAVLVNAARGELVDEAALLEALESGHLAGAALDTFEAEPYTGPLAHLDNVVLTPHIGSYGAEARIGMERDAVANLIEVLSASGEGERAR